MTWYTDDVYIYIQIIIYIHISFAFIYIYIYLNTVYIYREIDRYYVYTPWDISQQVYGNTWDLFNRIWIRDNMQVTAKRIWQWANDRNWPVDISSPGFLDSTGGVKSRQSLTVIASPTPVRTGRVNVPADRDTEYIDLCISIIDVYYTDTVFTCI